MTFDPKTLIPPHLLDKSQEKIDGRVSGSSGVFNGGKYSYKAVEWSGKTQMGSSFELTFKTGNYPRHQSQHIEEINPSVRKLKRKGEQRNLIRYTSRVKY